MARQNLHPATDAWHSVHTNVNLLILLASHAPHLRVDYKDQGQSELNSITPVHARVPDAFDLYPRFYPTRKLV